MEPKVKFWLERLKDKSFGVILPNGWLGRPFDDLWELDSYSWKNDSLTMKFGQKFILTITGKELCYRIEKVPETFVKNENLIITKFSQVTLERIGQGEILDLRTYTGEEMRIVGYGMYRPSK